MSIKPDPIRTLRAHQGAVTRVSYSATGEYCLTSGEDKTITLWNPLEEVKLKTYSGHGQCVRDVTASHDNCHLGSAGADRCAFYWDVATGKTLRRYRGHEAIVTCVKFNSASTVLISGGQDSHVRLHDLRSRSYEPIQVLDDPKDTITSIAIGEEEIVVGSVDGWLRCYDIRLGKLHEDFMGEPITSVTLSSDHQSVLVGCLDSTVRLIDKVTGQLLNDYTGHTHKQLQLQAVPWWDDSGVVGLCEKGNMFHWEFLSGKVLQTLPFPTGAGMSQTVASHPVRKHVITGHMDGGVRVWEVKGDKPPEEGEREKSMSMWALPPRQ
eukprot:sb/3466796/